ncbi:hypothetical protein C0J52_27368 [Blattella germanica]|nr:hypothetical protein C0J52_27368 [Blattella germanica]
MQLKKAQTEPEATDAVHDATIAIPGEEVPGEAIPEHRGARRVLQFTSPHRDAGEDLVPEPTREGEAAARGRDREAQDGRRSGGEAPALVWAGPPPPLLPPPPRPPPPAPGAARGAGAPPHGGGLARKAPHAASHPTSAFRPLPPPGRRHALPSGHLRLYSEDRVAFTIRHWTLVTSSVIDKRTDNAGRTPLVTCFRSGQMCDLTHG